MKICLFVLTQFTNVTDTQTDGHRMTAKAALDASIARQKSWVCHCKADGKFVHRSVLVVVQVLWPNSKVLFGFTYT